MSCCLGQLSRGMTQSGWGELGIRIAKSSSQDCRVPSELEPDDQQHSSAFQSAVTLELVNPPQIKVSPGDQRQSLDVIMTLSFLKCLEVLRGDVRFPDAESA